MEFDEKKLYETLLVKYRQRLDVTTFELEKSEARSEQKDQRIAALIHELEATRQAAGLPSSSSADPVQPKPGPPPAR